MGTMTQPVVLLHSNGVTTYTVHAIILGDFAIHRETPLGEIRGWYVTHVPSGNGVMPRHAYAGAGFARKNIALRWVRILQQFARTVQWNTAKQRITVRVKRLAQNHLMRDADLHFLADEFYRLRG